MNKNKRIPSICGKSGTEEINFVAEKFIYKYVEIYRRFFLRETDNLKEIKDNYSKYIPSNHPLDEGNVEGDKDEVSI